MGWMTVHARQFLTDAGKDETILRLMALVESIEERHRAEMAAMRAHYESELAVRDARIAALEVKLEQPPKTPDNSSTPPSAGRKPNGDGASAMKRRAHAGAHRPLHPNPTFRRDLFATACRCGADVSSVAQRECEAYDHVEIPPIVPTVTRVALHGGKCPCCGGAFKADAPADMPRGSPYGPNLRALALHLRYTQAISFDRLAKLLSEMLGVTISEGALVNIVMAACAVFAAQASAIRARLLAGTALQSDETGLRVGKKNWWLWVFHHGDSAAFVADASRAKRVVEAFLAGQRPDYWVSDRYGAQLGWAGTAHQFCVAHLIRDAQYAEDCGDGVFATKLIHLLKRACRIGRRRDRLTDSTLKVYLWRLETALDEALAFVPSHEAGAKLQKVVKKARTHLFVFMTNRDVPATNNESERSLRPAAVFRKVTNGFRTEWGVAFYADFRSVVETARRRSVGALEAIRLTLAGKPLPLHA